MLFILGLKLLRSFKLKLFLFPHKTFTPYEVLFLIYTLNINYTIMTNQQLAILITELQRGNPNYSPTVEQVYANVLEGLSKIPSDGKPIQKVITDIKTK